MNKKFISKILGITAVVVLSVGSVVMAAVSLKPEFIVEKYNMKLGTTQKLSALIDLESNEYYKITSSFPSVIEIKDDATIKAVGTGLSTLSYTYIDNEGKTKTIECYVEVSKNESTYSEVDKIESSKINITLELGDYTTVIESSIAAIPNFPKVTKPGYVLEGWYRDAAYNVKVNARDRFSSDVTLYAKWVTEEEAKQTITSYSELYDDINNHWARNYIESVSYKGLFNGVAERTFGPEMTMTRAMVITVLGRLDEVEKAGRTTNFKDVPAGTYYEEYVAWGVENKIVSGINENEFLPNKEITREEMAVMMANYVKYKGHKYELKQIAFRDKDQISTWALESVKILNNLKIMQGNSDGTYNPKKIATRAEIATIFYNYINYLNQNY